MKPVVNWPGGKSKLAAMLTGMFPQHQCYCEVFGGGLAVLLEKEPSPVEVVNDINRDLITFYRVVKYHLQEFLKELAWVPVSREEFSDFKAQQGLTDIQRAARWFYRNKNSFGGLMQNFGTSKVSPPASRRNQALALETFNQRMDRVCIENLDWENLILRYDSENTLFFLDPPYFEGYQYGNAWSLADHVRLRDRLFALKGLWVLTYDDNPQARDLYDGCFFLEVTHRRGIGNNHKTMRKDFPQLIITPKVHGNITIQ